MNPPSRPSIQSVPSVSPIRQDSEGSSPASASPNGQPSARVLARNSACHQCRKRKLRCDAKRPICTNCSKPRVRGGGKGPEEDECTWDEAKEPSARTRRRREYARKKALEAEQGNARGDDEEDVEGSKKKKTKLNELENRIAAFEAALGSSNQPDQAAFNESPPNQSGLNGSTSNSHPAIDSSAASYNKSASKPHEMSTSDFLETLLGEPYVAGSGGAAAGSTSTSHSANAFHMTQDGSYGTVRQSESDSDVPLNGVFDIMWPDWHQDLPQRGIVEHMIIVFFEKVPLVPRMLRKSSLLQSLQLPPSHGGFPIRSLLHAILALTSNFISPVALSTRAYFPVGATFADITHPEQDFGQPPSYEHSSFPIGRHRTQDQVCPTTPLARFQMWHRRKAFESLTHYLDRGDKFLQCLQAHVIVSYVDQYNAWWTDLWMEAGAAIRMATPLRINESPNVSGSSLRRYVSYLILPASNALEQAERDRTFWSAFLLERMVTLCTTWPTTLVNDEVTVELPVLQSVYERGYGPLTGVQTLQTPDLLVSHPDVHQDSLCILIKAVTIAYDVNVFFRRYSRGSHSIATYLSHPTFQKLLGSINSFRTHLPPDFRRPTKCMAGSVSDMLDRDLIMAIWIIHSASLTLGEPLVTKETWTTDCARMALSSIRATLSLLYDIAATSYDLTRLPPQCSHCWGLSARALVRFVDAATQCGDHVSASVFRSEIEVFRLALQQYGDKFPIGLRHLKVLDDLVANQDMWGGVSTDQPKECYKTQIIGLQRQVGARSATDSSQSVVTPTGDPTGEYPVEHIMTNCIHVSTGVLSVPGSGNTIQCGEIDPSLSSSSTEPHPPPPPPPPPASAPAPAQAKVSTTNPIAQLYTQNQSSQMSGVFDFSSPAFLNCNLDINTSTNPNPNPNPNGNSFQDGWDISSLSFDVNAVASMFEASGAVFNGEDFVGMS